MSQSTDRDISSPPMTFTPPVQSSPGSSQQTMYAPTQLKDGSVSPVPQPDTGREKTVEYVTGGVIASTVDVAPPIHQPRTPTPEVMPGPGSKTLSPIPQDENREWQSVDNVAWLKQSPDLELSQPALKRQKQSPPPLQLTAAAVTTVPLTRQSGSLIGRTFVAGDMTFGLNGPLRQTSMDEQLKPKPVRSAQLMTGPFSSAQLMTEPLSSRLAQLLGPYGDFTVDTPERRPLTEEGKSLLNQIQASITPRTRAPPPCHPLTVSNFTKKRENN